MPEGAYDILNRYISVSHETAERLSLYYDLLVKWQKKINLVGPDTIGEAWLRHFIDSLQLQSLIPLREGEIVDFGSGAGFPGLVLAVAGIRDVHLIESDGKKISFLREVSRVTKTPVTIHHDRIERVAIDNVSAITSRACASLDQLLQFASRFVSHETICLFPKGKNYSKGIEDAKMNWVFELDIIQSIVDSQGVILKISHLRKRGSDNERQDPSTTHTRRRESKRRRR